CTTTSATCSFIATADGTATVTAQRFPHETAAFPVAGDRNFVAELSASAAGDVYFGDFSRMLKLVAGATAWAVPAYNVFGHAMVASPPDGGAAVADLGTVRGLTADGDLQWSVESGAGTPATGRDGATAWGANVSVNYRSADGSVTWTRQPPP